MRKRTISQAKPTPTPPDPDWLNLAALAEVEITSEEPACPIEAALIPGSNSGWRAAEPGPQTVRIVFGFPRRLRRIVLAFEEAQMARTQEFVLRWSQGLGQPYQEIVRQQWNFSPEGSTSQYEDLHVNLPEVGAIELEIIPDISGCDAIATLQQWRLA